MVFDDKSLQKELRDQVAAIFKSGKMDDLTVKRVRLATEKKLGLDEGYFKTTGDWKARSDKIIKEEVAIQDEAKDKMSIRSSSPPHLKKAIRSKKSRAASESKQSSVSNSELSENDFVESEEEVTKPKKRELVPAKKGSKSKPVKQDSIDASDTPEESNGEFDGEADYDGGEPNSNKHAMSESEMSDVLDEEPKPTRKRQTSADTLKKEKKNDVDESESDMSVVLDEEPKPQRKRQKTSDAKKEKKKAAPKAKEDTDPDQAEIKRLQGWLVKCGIRKMWFRELAPYETPKEKIKHLKGMLEDAGMKGRYSLERANEIRDARELAADLEQIQQGAKQWGNEEEQGASDSPAPRRAAAARGRQRQALAFLDDEDEGEESD
ncbi:hypothetical protein N7495_009767 [Penicillium taxi]|uniref:uncharacterized protein n=1 Tax=Penicillium taxi TaxID=168475 RepID=UPI002545B73B|nr:uncharacterized protein N7495_009767 [Penicillium taxi]KAJ5885257.1 hypothetical protein N7495_009767 [Penicillium taxi]